MTKQIAVFASELDQFDEVLSYLFDQIEYEEVNDYIKQKKIVSLFRWEEKSASSEDRGDEDYMGFIEEFRALMNFVVDNRIDVILGD
jgi:hypothetical protein